MIITTLVIGFTNCKTKKNSEDEVKLKNYSDKELIDLMVASDLTCPKVKSKGSVELSFREDDYSLRGNFRVQTDSVTWISLSKSTIPVAMALISEDSLKVLNKIGKQYYLNTMDKINELINSDVDYELLKDFFLGKAVAFDYENDYKVQKDDNSYLISSEKSKKIEKLIKKGKIKEPILYRCWIDPTNFKCKRVVINLLDQDAELTVTYSDWKEMGDALFPMYASLQIVTPLDSASLEINYSKVECVEGFSFPFKIPDSYEPIIISDE